MVCEVCQKSIASFSTLLSTWLIANDWNEYEIKENIGNFEVVEVKKENIDNTGTLSDCNNYEASSSCIKSATISNKGHLTSSDGESSSKKIKTESNEYAEIDQFQLKNEEINIKDEDE